MKLTERERKLLAACVDAELENNDQGDTNLSLDETEEAKDPDKAHEALRTELQALQRRLEA